MDGGGECSHLLAALQPYLHLYHHHIPQKNLGYVGRKTRGSGCAKKVWASARRCLQAGPLGASRIKRAAAYRRLSEGETSFFGGSLCCLSP